MRNTSRNSRAAQIALASLLVAVPAYAAASTSSTTAATARPAYAAVTITGPRVRPVNGRLVRPATKVIVPSAWATTRTESGFRAVVANPRSGCRITLRLSSRIGPGPDVAPIDHVRALLPIQKPTKLYEETTRAQTDRPKGRASATRMAFDYSSDRATARFAERIGTPRDGRVTWHDIAVSSTANHACTRDNPLALIHFPADLSSMLAGIRTKMDR